MLEVIKTQSHWGSGVETTTTRKREIETDGQRKKKGRERVRASSSRQILQVQPGPLSSSCHCSKMASAGSKSSCSLEESNVYLRWSPRTAISPLITSIIHDFLRLWLCPQKLPRLQLSLPVNSSGTCHRLSPNNVYLVSKQSHSLLFSANSGQINIIVLLDLKHCTRHYRPCHPPLPSRVATLHWHSPGGRNILLPSTGQSPEAQILDPDYSTSTSALLETSSIHCQGSSFHNVQNHLSTILLTLMLPGPLT